MKLRLIKTPGLLRALVIASALSGGLTSAPEADAAPGSGMGGGMQGGAMHGKDGHGKGKHGGGHGRHCQLGRMQGHKECDKHRFGSGWKHTLSAEQKARLDQLHVNFAKAKAPLKTRIKALKVDLAILATAPQPDKAIIDAKIEELLKLKGQMLGAKYGYIAAQRQVLTPQQWASFDMDIIHDAMHGTEGKGERGRKH